MREAGEPTQTPSPALDRELQAGAVLLGGVILVAEGGYAGPMVATFLAVVVAALALLFWLIRARRVLFPVGLGWLIAMLMIGCLSAVGAYATGDVGESSDLVRDLLILFSYVGFVLVGCYYRQERDARLWAWWVLIAVGVVLSILHIWAFTVQIAAGVSDLYVLRLEAGRGSQVQLVAVIAACLVSRGRPSRDVWRTVAVLAASLCVLSIALALSRVLLLQLIIVAMAFVATRVDDHLSTLRLRLLHAVTVAAGGVAVLAMALLSLRFLSDAAFTFAYDGFVKKLLNSWNEVASTEIESVQDINDNYRAFEARRGIESFLSTGWFAQWFGQGWGTAVPLGLNTASTKADFVRTEAAFLHNGYVNYLVKGGILACTCYLAFMLRLVLMAIFQPVAARERVPGDWQRQALLAIVLCLAAASLTAGGFAFPSGFLSVALLLGTCLYTPVGASTYDDVRSAAG